MSLKHSAAAYQIGERVIHPSHGGCIVDAIDPKKIDGMLEDFYTLRPITKTNISLFVPVRTASNVGLRKAVGSKKAWEILSCLPELETNWIKDSPARKREYTLIVKQDDLIELARLFKTFLVRSIEQKISNADQSIFEFGKRKLISELALSLEETYSGMELKLNHILHKA